MKYLIKLLKPSLKLYPGLLQAFERWIVVVGKVGGLIRRTKLLGFIKKKSQAG